LAGGKQIDPMALRKSKFDASWGLIKYFARDRQCAGTASGSVSADWHCGCDQA